MSKERFWEIDFARGLAIIRMVIFNWSFALFYLKVYNFKEGMVLPGLAAPVFIFLAGLSLTISYSRIKDRKPKEIYKKFFLRGLKLFGIALMITVITYITFPEAFIIFGIIDLIAFSVLFGQFFLKYRRLNLFLGLLIIILGFYLQGFRFDFPYLLWLGFIPSNFFTFDYFPVLPWFGFALLGIYFGNTFYKNGKRSFKIKDLSNNLIVKALDFLGRNSLAIYLLHQPLLIMLLLALGFKVF